MSYSHQTTLLFGDYLGQSALERFGKLKTDRTKLRKYFLKEDPFNIIPIKGNTSLFVGRVNEAEQLSNYVSSPTSNVFVLGLKGIGKTSLLYTAYFGLMDAEHFYPVMVPNTPPEMRKFFNTIMRRFIDDVFVDSYTGRVKEEFNDDMRTILSIRTNLKKYMSFGAVYPTNAILEDYRKLKDILLKYDSRARVVFLCDETNSLGTSAAQELLEQFNTFLEAGSQVFVFSAFPTIRERMNKICVSTSDRIVNEVAVRPFNFQESYECIIKRLESQRLPGFKGAQVHPFTEEGLNKVIDISDGIPRVLMILAKGCLRHVLGFDEERLIDEKVVEEVAKTLGHTSEQKVMHYLSEKKQKVMKVIAERTEVGVTELAEALKITKGTAHQHLNELKSEGLVRKNENRKYQLTFTPEKIL